MAELASLYEYVQKMPDGPQKQMFLKKVSIIIIMTQPETFEEHLTLQHPRSKIFNNTSLL